MFQKRKLRSEISLQFMQAEKKNTGPILRKLGELRLMRPSGDSTTDNKLQGVQNGKHDSSLLLTSIVLKKGI